MQRRHFIRLAIVSGFAGVACRRSDLVVPLDATVLNVSSSAFAAAGSIPERYTCDGEDSSPPLSWDSPPAGTASLALICDDPDAPIGTWVHWVIYNLPPTLSSLPAAIPAGETIPGGGLQGRNDFNNLGYGGPCPPSGEHRYFFKLFALDTTLDLAPGARKADLEAQMTGHILAAGELLGLYARI